MAKFEVLYRDGLNFLANDKPGDAEKLFRKCLTKQPGHLGALNLLTIALMRLDRYGEAEKFIRAALKISQSSDVSFYNCGIILLKLGRPHEAIEAFNHAVGLNPNVHESWNNRGAAYNDVKQYEAAISDFDRAISLNNDYADAYANKGNSLRELKRYDAALAAFDKALTLKPDLAAAWLGRSSILSEFGRHADALAASDQALRFKPDSESAWLWRGNLLGQLKRYDDAFAAYDRSLALKPNLADAWLGRGNLLIELKRADEARDVYDRALALKPNLANAWLGRGNVFSEFKRYDEAIAAYDKALALEPDLANAWLGRGNAFDALKRYEEAIASYDKAFALKPELPGLEGARLHARMHLCDWSNFDADCEHLISAIRIGTAATEPFKFLAIPSSSEDQLKCASLWVSSKFPDLSGATGPKKYDHARINIAYLSADFHQHATSYLAAGLFEQHDRSKFEVTALSLGINDASPVRERHIASFERFLDVATRSDDQIANLIRSLEIDVLVDVNGFTKDSRTSVFARRPAPVQVTYLGYPGTMGAKYIDYIIADQVVIPEKAQEMYSEKVVCLPNSYQVNDDKRPISANAISAADAGLPPTGFVYCCFNNNYKISPSTFDCWMRILKQVEGSVLWLLEDNEKAANNLRSAAVSRGVAAERLVFAKRMPLPDHLARHRLADLFLDTLPYNAHTTASDALWAGLPVLTCLGETFAGRVAASLLQAIRLPELVTATTQAYERMAIDLATHPELLAMIKAKLAQNRLTTPLFDTKLFTRHLESAYTAMHARHQAGLAPDRILI
jgi:protein O-GlcNAc transferase